MTAGGWRRSAPRAPRQLCYNAHVKRKRLPFEILYEDDDIVVIDKPAGLLATHTRLHGARARAEQPTAENFLNDYVRKGQAKSRKRVWLVHRLDRETSGVMMFAKSAEVADRMRSDWSNLTEKTYLARVEGTMSGKSGVFETERKVVSESRGTSLVEVKLHTGRKNQIRVHFAEAGHPVLGDVKYGGRKARRLFLHSTRLKVRDKGVFESCLDL